MHGAQDANLKLAIVDQHKAGLAHAQVQMMPNVGHGPFWDDAVAFNGHLRSFCERLQGTGRFKLAELRRPEGAQSIFAVRCASYSVRIRVVRCRAP